MSELAVARYFPAQCRNSSECECKQYYLLLCSKPCNKYNIAVTFRTEMFYFMGIITNYSTVIAFALNELILNPYNPWIALLAFPSDFSDLRKTSGSLLHEVSETSYAGARSLSLRGMLYALESSCITVTTDSLDLTG